MITSRLKIIKYRNILINPNFHILFLMMLALFSPDLRAQISLPNGNILNLNTNNDFLYMETRIFFNTGMYKTDDYNWEKMDDSLVENWFITACFNGECRNELADSGNFIRDYGLNDTTGFIAFHVETYKYDGYSRIKYKVYNKNDYSDQQDLIFNISYKNNTVINTRIHPPQIKIINPAINSISIINVDMVVGDISIYDASGKKVYSWNSITTVNNKISLDLPQGLSGLYILKLTTNGIHHHRK